MPRKIYTREFSEHEGNPLVLEESEDDQCFVLGFPHEFVISRVIIQQVDGTARTGTLDVYDAPPCSLDDVGDGSESIAPVPNPNLHKVIPQQSFSAGNATSLFAASAGGPGWEFVNREGSHSVPKRRIFIRLTSTTAPDQATFDLIITGQPAVGTG